VLQHRGQDAAGIMTAAGASCSRARDRPRARRVQQQRTWRAQGQRRHRPCALSRPPAATASEAQPFYVNAPYGICLAHNGNLTNAAELGEVLMREDRRHLNTSSDSEVLLNVFASELQRVGTAARDAGRPLRAPSPRVYRRCRGAMPSSRW
jgi:amidophosphoribosyltransferase